MCRIDRANFGASSGAPAEARHWVTDVLTRWEVTPLAETANLLTSELVSNAVRHAQSGPTITAAVANGFLEVGVTDGRSGEVPRVGSAIEAEAVGGRGMAIVEALSVAWGVHDFAQGKQVWFRLEATDWSFLPACRCSNEHTGRVFLGSGHGVVPNPGPWDRDVKPG
jgi:anti-sigma regulatory factor (Ser/Thr protein kinase)